MYDDRVLRRWLRLEANRMNDGVAAERPTLAALLAADRPVSVTRGGDEYRYDPAVLRSLNDRLPHGLARRLRLPVLLFARADVPDSCSLTDPSAFEALQALGEISHLREFRDGQAWIGRAIAFGLVARYPTAVQIAFA
ncbi:MAG: DUF61 family protein [Methanospirillum sp.]|nr:DUF61 family protein [Methanospirillum sp.]